MNAKHCKEQIKMSEQIENQAIDTPVVENVVQETPVVENVVQETPVVESTQETPVVEEPKLTQEEFNKVYFEKKQAERELAALKAKLEQPTTQPQSTAPTELVKPTLEQFDYDEDEYREALIDYKVELKLQQKQQAYEQHQQQASAKTQSETIAQSFNDKCVALEQSNPTYAAALNNQQAVQFTNHVYAQFPHIAQAVLESDFGAQLDYHFLTNPADAERLSKLSPMNAIKELGKLEMRYTGSVKQVNAPKGKVISNAPEPVNSVNGSLHRDTLGDSVDDMYERLYGAKP